MITINLLKLHDDKYYIIKTIDPNVTIKYFIDCESAWLKMYEPIGIVAKIHNCDINDEDKYTLMCMNQYGIENVRGGTFSNPQLTINELNMIHDYFNNIRINHTISYAQPMPKPGPYLTHEQDKMAAPTDEIQPYLTQEILTKESDPYTIQDKETQDTPMNEKQPYIVQDKDSIVLPKIETKPYLIYESQHN